MGNQTTIILLHNRPSPVTAFAFATESLFDSKCLKLNYIQALLANFLPISVCCFESEAAAHKQTKKGIFKGVARAIVVADSAHACTYCKVFPWRFMNSWTGGFPPNIQEHNFCIISFCNALKDCGLCNKRIRKNWFCKCFNVGLFGLKVVKGSNWLNKKYYSSFIQLKNQFKNPEMLIFQQPYLCYRL